MSDYSFQDDAIKSISSCFKRDKSAKQLLVIPTGGGKTLTALRAINRMLFEGVITKNRVVYWVQHLNVLQAQTQNVLDENIHKGKFLGHLEECHADLKSTVKVKMIEEATKQFGLDNPCLVIIDEAHHSAASSYGVFFQENTGVLGLTATPKRLDQNEFDFDDIVYSVTANELIKRGVIVRPIIHPIKTGARIHTDELQSSGGQFDAQSEFDTGPRNMFVAERIFNARHQYRKGILFVRTREHARNLAETLKGHNERFNEGDNYEHVGYILGGNENDRGISNDAYLAEFKQKERALLVNCGVLTEGFDDPTINSVIMVVPTKSIVYYLQCIGRAIRAKKQGYSEKAFIVEFEDDMPNVGYRIDNKWLFADISDELEPEILDRDYSTFGNLKTVLHSLEDEFRLKLWELTEDTFFTR